MRSVYLDHEKLGLLQIAAHLYKINGVGLQNRPHLFLHFLVYPSTIGCTSFKDYW